ncbi:MAG: cobalamin-dependent protein [Deltaproteobacteria bacterium]|nr:cobalamin-dependent protein [Deltaproteobacteria bacterium]
MRCLLINPAMDLARLGRVSGLLEPMPPTGLASVAGSLAAAGEFVRVVDMFAEGLGGQEVLERAVRFRPDVVGMSVMTPSAPVCAELSSRIRAAVPGVRILWGGVHADVFGPEIVEAGHADAVVHGDGERAAVEILAAWSEGRDLSGIRGVTWAQDGRAVLNEVRPPDPDLDTLPWPAWDLFPIHRYGLLPFADMAKPVLTLAASRGCPYRCAYCSLLHLHGKTYRRRDPVKVVDEYQWLLERFGVRQVGFVDPIFPLHIEDLRSFCEEILRRGLQERCVWLSETRADRLDPETCRLMYASGCRRVLLGIESGSVRLLENVNKRLDVEEVRNGVQNAREAGIQTVGLFMIGLPGETPVLTRQTVEFAVSLDLDFAKFAITVPFPGSALFHDAWQKTLFRDDWENYVTFNPDPDRLVYHPDGYDPAELIRMQSWALRRFYARPRQVRRQLFELRTLTPRNVLNGLWGMVP